MRGTLRRGQKAKTDPFSNMFGCYILQGTMDGGWNDRWRMDLWIDEEAKEQVKLMVLEVLEYYNGAHFL